MDVTYHFKALKNEKKGSVIVNVLSKALFCNPTIDLYKP